ncbi:MAG: N-acetyltransferase [Alphaproteobacteria bacterium]|nr:N-acetyltransferase [Alphaproteobacteria bacterium]
MDENAHFQIDFVERLADLPRADWNACAGVGNPFVSYDFLSCLEDSRSVSADAGWLPRHMAARDGTGRVVGCAPVYVKGHSQGEYVFDQGWARAYEQAGGRYYPKLLCAVPFTPVGGPRLLTRDAAVKSALAEALARLCGNTGLSGAHVNFTTETDQDALDKAGYLTRLGIQYHWTNAGYESFDHFLDALTARKRKAIRRERRAAAEAGLRIERLSGNAVTPAHWDAMYAFYQDTGARKWGRPYLNRAFFDLLGERMAEQVLLAMAYRDGRPIAGALNLIGGDALYGRYWGCVEDVPFLHFELCYHQAIEAAIERGLTRVEAGAQGEHKIARGYLPILTRSAHRLADPGFHKAVADAVERERRAVLFERDLLMEENPFRKNMASG